MIVQAERRIIKDVALRRGAIKLPAFQDTVEMASECDEIRLI